MSMSNLLSGAVSVLVLGFSLVFTFQAAGAA
jgi:hypothetical protein